MTLTVLIVFTMTFHSILINSQCDVGWTFSVNQCYRLFPSPGATRKWREAEGLCNSHGGTLAIIHSQDECDFIGTLMSEKPAIIGLRDESQTGLWLWSDGTFLSYSGFRGGEGGPGVEDCVIMDRNLKWWDGACIRNFDSREYVCQKAPNTSVQKARHTFLKKWTNKKLQGTALEIHWVASDIQCTIVCIRNPLCKSFNYKRTEKTCHILDINADGSMEELAGNDIYFKTYQAPPVTMNIVR